MLAPDEGWERGANNAGVEDPRVTWVPSLGLHVMTYVAYGPLGPRLALAVSADLRELARGSARCSSPTSPTSTPTSTCSRTRTRCSSPSRCPARTASRAYAMLHRPMWDLGWFREGEGVHLPAGVTDDRPGHLDLLRAGRRGRARRPRPRPTCATTGCVALSEHPCEELKIGAGPPPLRVDEGWLLIHHGVTGEPPAGFDPTTQQVELRRRRDAARPATTRPGCWPAPPSRCWRRRPTTSASGTVPNVVFPTAIEEVDGVRYVFYGMADARSASRGSTTRDATPLGLGLAGAGGFGAFLAARSPTCPACSVAAVRRPRPGSGDRAARPRTAASATATLAGPARRRPGRRRGRRDPAGTARRGRPRRAGRRQARVLREAARDRPSADAREVAAPRPALRRAARRRPRAALQPAAAGAGHRLQDELLGPLQRFAFENDASDEDLPPDHWFWDEATSGGIFVEHGVHFFDAAAPAARHRARRRCRRPPPAATAAPIDLVERHRRCTRAARSPPTPTASRHAHRCERQLMRLDHGAAEARVEGWIPLRRRSTAWTDDAGADAGVRRCPARAAALFDVPGSPARRRRRHHRRRAPRRRTGRRPAVAAATSSLPHRVVLELDARRRRRQGSACTPRACAPRSPTWCPPLPAGHRSAPAPSQALAATTVADAARRSAAEGRRSAQTSDRERHRPPTPREDLMSTAASTGNAGPRPAERVDKPWGHEEIFAVVEGRYVGKLLTVTGR